MRPSTFGLPSTYLNTLKSSKNEIPTSLFKPKKIKQPTISLPRNSIVDTPLNNGLKQPQLRRTSVFMSTPLTVSTTPYQLNSQRSVVVKNAPLTEMGKIVEQLKRNGKIESVNQTNSGDIKITFEDMSDAHKVIANGLIVANGKQYLVNGINQFGEEYGCGDVIQQLMVKPQQSILDNILHLFGLK